MPHHSIFRRASIGLVLAIFVLATAARAHAGALRAAAVKVDITPADPSQLTNQWGVPFAGIHDRTYARVLVVNDGTSTAAIISIDTVEVADTTEFAARLSKETGIPTSNIAITATHDHNAPIAGMTDASEMHPAGPGGKAFLTKLYDDLIKAVKQAQASLQPARMGVNTGVSYININRDEPIPGGGYRMGADPYGPSDKAVWVLRFDSLSGGPIALLINYAVHSTIIGMKNNLLTGELAGATERFVEQSYNNKVVALWTLGAAGDQAPIVSNPENDPSNFEPVNVLGRILGEEVVRVSNGMNSKAMISQARIWGAEQYVSCPGQRDDGGRPAPAGTVITDPGPTTFRLGVIMLDKIALTEVSGEVVTSIYQKLRKQSPYSNTLMLTLANGRIGYIPDDAAYDLGKPEAKGMAALKKGCGESTIVNGLLDLLSQY